MKVNIKISITPSGKTEAETMEINIESSKGFKDLFNPDGLIDEIKNYAAHKMNNGPFRGSPMHFDE